jgi:hypothetical protein
VHPVVVSQGCVHLRFNRSEKPNRKAPEVLKTPGASFLVAGGRYDTVCDLPVALLLPVAGQVEARAA